MNTEWSAEHSGTRGPAERSNVCTS